MAKYCPVLLAPSGTRSHKKSFRPKGIIYDIGWWCIPWNIQVKGRAKTFLVRNPSLNRVRVISIFFLPGVSNCNGSFSIQLSILLYSERVRPGCCCPSRFSSERQSDVQLWQQFHLGTRLEVVQHVLVDLNFPAVLLTLATALGDSGCAGITDVGEQGDFRS